MLSRFIQIIKSFRKERNPKFKIQNPKFNSSALGYAITFLLLIGLICSGVLFISSVNKRLEYNYTMKEHLIMDNSLSLIIGANLENQSRKTIIHPAGDTSQIDIKQWGAFKMIVAKTFHKNKIQQKTALSGIDNNDNLPAFYLADNNQALKLAGNVKIEGSAYLPERGVESAYITGKSYSNDKLIYGDQKKSENYLPKIKEKYQNITLESFIKDSKKIEDIGKDSSYSFDTKTNLYSTISPVIIDNKIKGNIVIHSFDSIYVTSNSNLENVILIAPKIRFQKEFKGSVQAIATNQIVCEENVTLSYPSTLYLNENTFNISEKNNQIILKEKAKVLGGILMLSSQSNFRKPMLLSIAPKSVASGIVYNQGSSEISGSVIGYFYTQNLYLKAGGGEYTNHLMDCVISSKLLPKEFIIPDWLESQSKNPKNKIINTF